MERRLKFSAPLEIVLTELSGVMFCLSFVLSYILIICYLILCYIHFHLALGNCVAYIFMLSLKVPTCFRLLKFLSSQQAMKQH